MKHGLARIIGKQVAAIVYARQDGAPGQRMFLAFSDGTSLEFRGDNCRASVSEAAHIERVTEAGGGRVDKVFGDLHAATRAKPVSLEGLLTRDLHAWRIAKGVIAKAKGG